MLDKISKFYLVEKMFSPFFTLSNPGSTLNRGRSRANLVLRVLRLPGQRLVARRDSEDIKFLYRRISAVKQWKPLRNSQSKNLNFIDVPSNVAPCAHPLTKGFWVRELSRALAWLTTPSCMEGEVTNSHTCASYVLQFAFRAGLVQVRQQSVRNHVSWAKKDFLWAER